MDPLQQIEGVTALIKRVDNDVDVLERLKHLSKGVFKGVDGRLLASFAM